MDKINQQLNKPSDPNKEDFGDKGLDSVEKKFMGKSAGRGTNEKITDKARDMFEKATGKNVPDKVSN